MAPLDEEGPKREVTAFDQVDIARLPIEESKGVPVLICLHGGHSHLPLELRKHQTSIGRVPQCDVRLDKPNISRVHANIYYDNPNATTGDPICTLADSDSRNGTFLNFERLTEPKRLCHGDKIIVGDYVFGFYVRKQSEVTLERRVYHALSRYGQDVRFGRFETQLKGRLRLLVPEETFTPRTVDGTVKDLSLNGLRFITTEIEKEYFTVLLKHRSFLRCELTFLGSNVHVTVAGRFAWGHYDSQSTPGICLLGMEFTQVPEETHQFLEKTLETLVEERLSSGRDGNSGPIAGPGPGAR